jgi:hypothetical protein
LPERWSIREATMRSSSSMIRMAGWGIMAETV